MLVTMRWCYFQAHPCHRLVVHIWCRLYMLTVRDRKDFLYVPCDLAWLGSCFGFMMSVRIIVAKQNKREQTQLWLCSHVPPGWLVHTPPPLPPPLPQPPPRLSMCYNSTSAEVLQHRSSSSLVVTRDGREDVIGCSSHTPSGYQSSDQERGIWSVSVAWGCDSHPAGIESLNYNSDQHWVCLQDYEKRDMVERAW